MSGFAAAGLDAAGTLPEALSNAAFAALVALTKGAEGRDWIVLLELVALQRNS